MSRELPPPISTDQDFSPRRGAIPHALGVILVILGSLDSMLAWRGSFEVSNFSAAIIVAGLIFYSIGVVKGRQDRAQLDDLENSQQSD